MNLFAAKVQFKNFEDFHLVEVPLKGQTTADLKNGTASFHSIKFDTTSYNNEVSFGFSRLVTPGQ